MKFTAQLHSLAFAVLAAVVVAAPPPLTENCVAAVKSEALYPPSGGYQAACIPLVSSH
jgi:hypothetical protein